MSRQRVLLTVAVFKKQKRRKETTANVLHQQHMGRKLGLANVSAISGSLTVQVDHARNQIPFAINPSFLEVS